MSELSYTLTSDGPTDRQLLPLITWSLAQRTTATISATWADPSTYRNRPQGLRDRIASAVDYYPCDILFVHRDAEREPIVKRLTEIQDAVNGLGIPVVVPVVPVRMQEAWFLFDEGAIRSAANNPNGTMPLNLPSLGQVESLPDPKNVLRTAITTATDLSGRHLAQFRTTAAMYRVGEFIQDFGPLTVLPGYRSFDDALAIVFR